METEPHPDLTVSREELLVQGSDSPFRDMLHDMLSLLASLEHVRARFGGFIGLTGVQYTLLVSVRQLQRETGVGVRELADHLGLSAPFVTVETTKLVKLGVLDKAPNPDDMRRVRLSVTERGRSLLRQLAPLQREVNDAIFEPLSREDFARQCQIIRDLRRSAERAVTLSDYLLDDSGSQQ
ncbi:MarR family winged helix-turn-helix transcriptional regulator [Pararhodobacter sp.]|uniref:MarR family winged helix-turn-helix transcriptional regulator n=1 Tax=Pararhodobacter sp. TaxID=2127056 RepID=UPI002FDDDF37